MATIFYILSFYELPYSLNGDVSILLDPVPSDLTSQILYRDEEILKVLIIKYFPWDDIHHHAYFILDDLVPSMSF